MNPIPRLVLVVSSALMLTLATRAESSAKDADNTARNERDRDSAAMTPGDQGNSPEDIATTKRIRQGIIADKSLSTNAHNVKIITAGGHVTLRGPVQSEQEKHKVEAIAQGVATAANVNSQLEVKSAQK